MSRAPARWARPKLISAFAAVALLSTVCPSQAANFGDDFSVNQTAITGAGSSTQAGSMTGGERDLQVSLSGGSISAGVTGGVLSVAGDGSANGSVLVVWDGNDNNATTVANNGLSGLNLSSGNDAFILGLNSLNGSPSLVLTVFTGANSSSVTLSGLTASSQPQLVRVAFSAFVGTANFANVGAVQLQINNPANATVVVDYLRTGSTSVPSIEATLTDVLLVDNDGNGKASAGDTLRYVTRIANNGGSTLTGVQFNAPAVANASAAANITATPIARDEGASGSSVPGDAFHTPFNTTLTVNDGDANEDLLNNDSLGSPAAAITKFGGGTLGGTVDSNNAGTTAIASGHSLAVNADGSFTYTPASGFTGLFTFQYRLANSGGSDTATVTLAVGERPVTVSDSHAVTGNVRIDTSTGTPVSVLDNDDGDAVTISLDTSGTLGAVSMSANGQFVYTPPRGKSSGTDTFSYTLSNGFGTSGSATVTLNFANIVWFIDGSAGAGDGRSHAPYNSLAAFNTANATGNATDPGDSQVIVLRDGTYANNVAGGALVLRNGQRVIGDGWSGTFSAAAGFSVAEHSAGADSFSGTDPTLSNSTGHGIALAANNQIRGVTVGDTPNGFGYSGGGVGSLSFAECSKIGAGGSISIASSGTVGTSSFDTLESTSSTGANLNLVGVTGALTVTSAGSGFSGSAAGSAAVNISGGSLSLTYPGAVTKTTSGRLFDVQSRTGGTLTFSGNLSQSVAAGTGINVASCSGGTVNFSGSSKVLNTAGNTAVTLANNTGATINFSAGGLAVSRTSGIGFTASGGGTITVTGGGNTIGSGSGTGLSVVNTLIGASGLTFQSIAASGAPNGIVLNNTGTGGGDGGLTITGDGVNASQGGNASGGTIQNTTGAGIVLLATKDVQLNYVTINNPGTDGIAIAGITGFTLNRSTINDSAGTGPYDAAIDFNNYSNGDSSITPTAVNGTVSIVNSLLGPPSGNSPHNTVTAVVGSGTSDWSVTGTLLRRTGNSAINLEVRNSAVIPTFTISGSSFAGGNTTGGNGSPSAGGIFVNTLDDSIIGLMKIENNDFSNNNIHLNLNQQNDTDPVGSHTFIVRNNTMTGARSHAMNVFAAAGSFAGSFTGTIQNNTIGNANIDGSGSEIGNGIRVNMNGGVDAAMLIDGNDIYETPNGRGIEVIGRNGLGQLDVTIINNLIDHYNLNYAIGGGAAAFPLGAIYVNAAKGGGAGIVGFRVRADVRSNTVPVQGGALPAASEVTGTYLALVESAGTETGGILELVDTPVGPGGQTPTQQLQSANTGEAGANSGVSLITGPIDVPSAVP